MAQSVVDPSNLKSFQRISQEDLRYLKELGKAIDFARESRQAQQVEPEKEKVALRQLPRKFFNLLKSSVGKMMYETVPTHEVYASRE